MSRPLTLTARDIASAAATVRQRLDVILESEAALRVELERVTELRQADGERERLLEVRVRQAFETIAARERKVAACERALGDHRRVMVRRGSRVLPPLPYELAHLSKRAILKRARRSARARKKRA